jgi:hypothetical protein
MAAVTICGKTDIDIVLMARCARDRRVRACQRKRRIVVVKDRRLPTGVCRMARGARRREPRVRDGSGRSGKRGCMACIAVGCQPRVHIILMAVGTRHCYVAPRKGERSVAVIECRRLPGRERMACRTVGRESRVGRSVRRVEIV